MIAPTIEHSANLYLRSLKTFAGMMNATVGSDMARAAGLLRSGELVAIPTETVYGLAANAFDPDAVLKIFQVKERPAFDPLIVHIADPRSLDQVVLDPPASAYALIDAFWPGPLTLVLPKHPQVPDLVTSGLDTVAVRMPAHPMTLELLRTLPFPLAAPSANPFGYISPTTAQHVADQLGTRIPYILDGGPCSIGVESTILGWHPAMDGGHWSIYRHGGLPKDQLEKILGTLTVAPHTPLPIAPGMLTSHYAPRKPLYVGDINTLLTTHSGKRIGVITFRTHYPAHQIRILSEGGELPDAARDLFAALRELDASDCEVILAEIFPVHGLGLAINDRLHRASAQRP